MVPETGRPFKPYVSEATKVRQGLQGTGPGIKLRVKPTVPKITPRAVSGGGASLNPLSLTNLLRGIGITLAAEMIPSIGSPNAARASMLGIQGNAPVYQTPFNQVTPEMVQADIERRNNLGVGGLNPVLEQAERKGPRVLGYTPIEELRQNQLAAMAKYPKAAIEDPTPTEEDSLTPVADLTETVDAPDKSREKMRPSTSEEMSAYLGGQQNLQYFARPFGDLVTEEQINSSPGDAIVRDIMTSPQKAILFDDERLDSLAGLAGTSYTDADIAENLSDEAIESLKIKEATPFAGTTSRSEINEAVRARQRRMKEERTRKIEQEKGESADRGGKSTVDPGTRPTVDGKTDYILPYRNSKQQRRAAFLDPEDIMQGLKNREMQRGYITAGGQQYAITPEFIQSGNPKDLGPVLTSEQVAQAKAQELLRDTVENVINTPAEAENPTIAADDALDPADKKITPGLSGLVSNFFENNTAPKEMGGNAVDLGSADTPLSRRFTLTPEEIDAALDRGGFDELDRLLTQLRTR